MAHWSFTCLYALPNCDRSSTIQSIAETTEFHASIAVSHASLIALAFAHSFSSDKSILIVSGLIHDCSATYFTFILSGSFHATDSLISVTAFPIAPFDLYIFASVCIGFVGATSAFHSFHCHSTQSVNFQSGISTHMSAAHQAVFDILDSFVAVHVFHIDQAIFAPHHASHWTTVKTSLAIPTGSSWNDLEKFSTDQYLSTNACLHSGVATS